MLVLFHTNHAQAAEDNNSGAQVTTPVAQNGGIDSTDSFTNSMAYRQAENGSVLLKNTDSQTGTGIADATFDLFDSNEKLVQSELRSYSNGEITVNDLIPGDYYFIQTTVPQNYTIHSEQIPFVISSDQTTDLSVVNPKVTKKAPIFIGDPIVIGDPPEKPTATPMYTISSQKPQYDSMVYPDSAKKLATLPQTGDYKKGNKLLQSIAGVIILIIIGTEYLFWKSNRD